MALRWPSIRARILTSKLTFLLKISKGDNSLSARIYRSLAASDIESILLVRQCRFLESTYKTNFTSAVITSPDTVSPSQLKHDILDLDFSELFSEAASHPSQCFVQAVAASSEGSWLKVWDAALERGPSGTSSTLALLRLLSLHAFSDRKCPVPDCSHITDEKDSLCTHFLDSHTSLQMNINQCVDIITNCSEDMFSIGLTLNNIFREIWS